MTVSSRKMLLPSAFILFCERSPDQADCVVGVLLLICEKNVKIPLSNTCKMQNTSLTSG